MRSKLFQALADFEKAREKLIALKRECFPIGSLVRVDNSPVGKVVESQESPRRLSVLFENGNVWSFELGRVVSFDCPDETKSSEGCHACRYVGGCPKKQAD